MTSCHGGGVLQRGDVDWQGKRAIWPGQNAVTALAQYPVRSSTVFAAILKRAHLESSMSERQALFISHASPEDNAFTIWLGAKLAAAGYEVWADVLRLTGGDDWQRKLEDALRNRACKVLLVANQKSVEKQAFGMKSRLPPMSQRGSATQGSSFR